MLTSTSLALISLLSLLHSTLSSCRSYSLLSSTRCLRGYCLRMHSWATLFSSGSLPTACLTGLPLSYSIMLLAHGRLLSLPGRSCHSLLPQGSVSLGYRSCALGCCRSLTSLTMCCLRLCMRLSRCSGSCCILSSMCLCSICTTLRSCCTRRFSCRRYLSASNKVILNDLNLIILQIAAM